MLSPSEYIVKELEQMRNRLVGFKVVYAFDEILNAHIVQISPRDDFKKDKTLLDWEVEFIERFENTYSDVEMILTAPLSFHHMTKILFECSPSIQGVKVVPAPPEEYCSQELDNNFHSGNLLYLYIYKNIERIFGCHTGVSNSSMCMFQETEDFALC